MPKRLSYRIMIDILNRIIIQTCLWTQNAWHSSKQDVYHTNPDCRAGDDMALGNIKPGKGKERDLCEICKDMK